MRAHQRLDGRDDLKCLAQPGLVGEKTTAASRALEEPAHAVELMRLEHLYARDRSVNKKGEVQIAFIDAV